MGSVVVFAAGLTKASWADDAAATPIVFVHGDSDAASIWQTVIWRFESNGYPRDRLAAISFTNPQARDADDAAQPDRSSTAEELAELSAFIDATLKRTGAAKVALVGLSRGGYSIRNYIANGGAARVSQVALCGTPNHGVFAIDALLGSEYNGRGAFLKKLNGAGDAEVTPGVPLLTLRSDGFDLYAQPDGRFLGHPEMKTNVDAEGPALKGATNLTLGEVDHRETATSPRAFAEIYTFIVGKAPTRIAIVPEAEVVLDGKVTGVSGETPTNLPVADAKVEIYAVSPDTGERVGAALLSKTTGADGVWGPLKTDGATPLEFVVAVPGHPVTHIYRSPFPRSFDLLKLAPAPAIAKDDADAAAILTMSRPRGYFGIPRDVILVDGRQPADIPPGVPGVWKTKLKMPTLENRPIVCEFNLERIVARAWPAKDGHVTIAELTY
jgi:pimeloyl-ACP methyl ester carboxylesterase